MYYNLAKTVVKRFVQTNWFNNIYEILLASPKQNICSGDSGSQFLHVLPCSPLDLQIDVYHH